jgi:hypothetical protein
MTQQTARSANANAMAQRKYAAGVATRLARIEQKLDMLLYQAIEQDQPKAEPPPSSRASGRTYRVTPR